MNEGICELLRRFCKEYTDENEGVDNAFFQALSSIKDKKYLTPFELLSIIEWKIGYFQPCGKYFDVVNNKKSSEIIECSRTAFKLADENKVSESLLILAKLLDIKGETIAIPSAILTFYDPFRFPVIDRNAWKALFGKEKTSFDVKDYEMYREKVTKLATKCQLSPRQIDCALYQMGKNNVILNWEV